MLRVQFHCSQNKERTTKLNLCNSGYSMPFSVILLVWINIFWLTFLAGGWCPQRWKEPLYQFRENINANNKWYGDEWFGHPSIFNGNPRIHPNPLAFPTTQHCNYIMSLFVWNCDTFSNWNKCYHMKCWLRLYDINYIYFDVHRQNRERIQMLPVSKLHVEFYCLSCCCVYSCECASSILVYSCWSMVRVVAYRQAFCLWVSHVRGLHFGHLWMINLMILFPM